MLKRLAVRTRHRATEIGTAIAKTAVLDIVARPALD
jgi:hypothetical protein